MPESRRDEGHLHCSSSSSSSSSSKPAPWCRSFGAARCVGEAWCATYGRTVKSPTTQTTASKACCVCGPRRSRARNPKIPPNDDDDDDDDGEEEEEEEEEYASFYSAVAGGGRRFPFSSGDAVLARDPLTGKRACGASGRIGFVSERRPSLTPGRISKRERERERVVQTRVSRALEKCAFDARLRGGREKETLFLF